jgi:GNAT superfamily N-acetyltransferase
VTDYASFAWFCDVFVLENHQKKGISKWMMHALMQHPELQTVRRFMLATRDAHGLYTQFGFQTGDSTRLMEQKPPALRWQEPRE